MIAPTKPIREKGYKTQLHVAPAPKTYHVNFSSHHHTLEELDRYFENIPEPRRRREAWLETGFGGGVIRYVESPEGEVLPGLPEEP